MGPAILEYMTRVDETLRPFDGAFRIHGAEPQVVEGSWRGNLIVIEFPDMQRARGWYDSASYRAILPLRTAYSIGDAILVDGVDPGYRAADTAAKLAQAGTGSEDDRA